MINKWIVFKTLLEARQKATQVKKNFKFYPNILYFPWDNTYRFCVTEKIAKILVNR